MVFAVVTGGGTSGHVIPAIAVLEALEDAGYSTSNLRYVGAERGIETRLMKDVPVEAVFLPISGFQRSLQLRRLWQNVLLPFRLLRSTQKAKALIAKWAPQVVVSLGGYASEPMARAARAAHVPLVCVSYDRIPGLATKRQQRYAAACAVAFADSHLNNATHTGAPIRRSIRSLNRASQRARALERYSLTPQTQVITVVGGSLGSAVLNEAVQGILQKVHDVGLSEIAVVHLCGERFMSTPEPTVPKSVTYLRIGYTDHMDDVYSMTDVLVCRAGASTVAEIAALGLCSIVVPWKDAAENHQELNARWLSDADAAVMLHEDDCNDGTVADVVCDLLVDTHRRQKIASAAYKMGELHRSSALVDLIVSVANRTVQEHR